MRLSLLMLLPLLGIAQTFPFPGPKNPTTVTAAGPILVASTCAASTDGGNVTTSAINTTGANALLFTVSYYGDPYGTSFSDNKGNTVTLVTFSARSAIGYVQNPNVGSGYQATYASGSNQPAICVFAFSGMSTTALYEGLSSEFEVNPGTSVQPGSLTPSGAGYHVFISGLNFDSTPATVTINSGFAATISAQPSGTNWGCGGSYLIQTGTAAQNPTWTSTVSEYVAATLAVFKGQ